MTRRRHRTEGRTIEVLARGVCIRAGKILLCHSIGAHNTFLPGGHVEFKEGAGKCLGREIWEETGRRARVGRFLGAVEHTFTQEGQRHCEVNLVFEVRIAGVEPDAAPASSERHIEFRWVSVSALERSTLEPFVLRRLIPRWIAGAGDAERWGSTVCGQNRH